MNSFIVSSVRLPSTSKRPETVGNSQNSDGVVHSAAFQMLSTTRSNY